MPDTVLVKRDENMQKLTSYFQEAKHFFKKKRKQQQQQKRIFKSNRKHFTDTDRLHRSKICSFFSCPPLSKWQFNSFSYLAKNLNHL